MKRTIAVLSMLALALPFGASAATQPFDWCLNIEGIQETVPSGLGSFLAGYTIGGKRICIPLEWLVAPFTFGDGEKVQPISETIPVTIAPQPVQDVQPIDVSEDTQETTRPITLGLLIESFETYNLGMLLGNEGWTDYQSGRDYNVVSTSTPYGSKAILANDCSDSVISIGVTSASDGIQSFGFHPGNKAGEFQFRLSQGQGFVSNTFATVSIKDNKASYYSPVGGSYYDFANLGDGWQQLDLEWRSSDSSARYRLNANPWTGWYPFNVSTDAPFTHFDDIGFDCIGPSTSYLVDGLR